MHDLQLYPLAPKPSMHRIACCTVPQYLNQLHMEICMWPVSKIHLKQGPILGAPSPALFLS